MDADYISVTTTLATFTIDQPRRCFNVTIIDDTEVELTEDFFAGLTLIPASVTTIDPSRISVDPAEATVSITDDDQRKYLTRIHKYDGTYTYPCIIKMLCFDYSIQQLKTT